MIIAGYEDGYYNGQALDIFDLLNPMQRLGMKSSWPLCCSPQALLPFIKPFYRPLSLVTVITVVRHHRRPIVPRGHILAPISKPSSVPSLYHKPLHSATLSASCLFPHRDYPTLLQPQPQGRFRPAWFGFVVEVARHSRSYPC